MLLTSAFRAAIVVAALVLPAQELMVVGGPTPRMSSWRLFATPNFTALKGMVCVQYGQPTWKPEYDAKLGDLKGKNLRLGKDFWTTFNTSIALDVGGAKVPAGAYYLGLSCDAKGEFSLAILKAEAADKAGVGPFTPDLWKADFTAAMKHATAEKSVDLMTITLNPDATDQLLHTLVVAWGKHTLTVPVKAQLAGSAG